MCEWREMGADRVLSTDLVSLDCCSLAVVVKLTVSLGMALTFPLQFFVPVQIMLPAVQERFEAHKRPVLVEMALRTGLVVLICEWCSFGCPTASLN